MGNYINSSDISTWPSGCDADCQAETIKFAEELVEKILCRHFYAKTFDISINGNDKNRLFLPLYADIIAVRHIYVGGIELAPSWYKWDENSVYLDLDAAMDELADGDFENWEASDALTYWLKSESGTSTINRETDSSYVHEGSYALRMDIDALNSDVYVFQDFTIQPNREYTLSLYRLMSAAGVTGQVMVRDIDSNVYLQEDGTWGTTSTWIEISNALSYTEFSLDFIGYPLYRDYRIIIDRKAATSESIYFDEASVQTKDGSGIADPELFYRLAIVSTKGLFPHGRNNIRAVGTHGESSIPQPLIEAIKNLVDAINDGSFGKIGMFKSEKIGRYSYSLPSKVTTAYIKEGVYTGIPDVDIILRHYIKQKKPVVMAP